MNTLTASDLNAALPYCFDNEIDWFHTTAQELPKGSHCVILGSGPGLMCLALLESNADLNLFSIDRDPTVVDTFNKHLHAGGFHVPPYIGDTCDPFPMELFGEESVDLLVVDADHSYEAVKRDIEHWINKVRYGGLVFFHDYIDIEQNGTNGVRRAIDDSLTDEWQEVDQVGISIVYRRVNP